MTDEKKPQPKGQPGKSSAMTRYVMGWAALAGLSLMYLGLVALNPSFVGAGPDYKAKLAEKDIALDRALGEIRELKGEVTRLSSTLSNAQSTVKEQNMRERHLVERIAVLESTGAPEEKSASKDAKKQKTVAKKPAPKSTAKLLNKPLPKPKKTAAAKPKPAPKKQVRTGSVAKTPAARAPITFGPAIVTRAKADPQPATPSYGVMIATGPSVDSLRLSWTLLTDRHGNRLRSLRPRYNRAAGPGSPLTLMAGPIKSLATAKRLCDDLLARGTACAPATFRGDAL